MEVQVNNVVTIRGYCTVADEKVMKLENDHIYYRPIDTIKPTPNNPNKHDEKQIASIADSIIHFGWTYPILISNDGYIVAGHGRYEAAKRLGLDKVPVMCIPNKWTEQDIRAYMIADNAIQERSQWDEQLLSLELNDLHELGYDLNLIGFTVDDLSSYMGYEDEVVDGTSNQSQPSLVNDNTIECPRCGYKWKLTR